MGELFNEANFPYNLRQDVSFGSLKRCHTSDLKLRVWLLLISEITRQNNFLAKILKSGNQIDVHVGSAKSTLLI